MKKTGKKFLGMMFLLTLLSTFTVSCNRTVEVEREIRTDGTVDTTEIETDTEVTIEDHDLDEDIDVKID